MGGNKVHMEVNTLRPCPRCQSEDIYLWEHDLPGVMVFCSDDLSPFWGMRCGGCGLCTPAFFDEVKATEFWNTATIEQFEG